ncbi:MAG TPA: hypothetical protein VGF95_09795 [Solirubrobacteraceae bacterium]
MSTSAADAAAQRGATSNDAGNDDAQFRAAGSDATQLHATGSDAARRHGDTVFTALKWISFIHSCVYLALLICAFAAGKPQPETFVLGLAHGLLWIFMSLACIAAAKARIVPLRLAVAVAVLGGIGPFFGSFEFLRAQRRRAAQREHVLPNVSEM